MIEKLGGSVVVFISIPRKLKGRGRETSNVGTVKQLYGGAKVGFRIKGLSSDFGLGMVGVLMVKIDGIEGVLIPGTIMFIS